MDHPPHPPYSPDLAPSDYHLILHLKKFLAGKRFDDDDELKDSVQKCLTSQAAAFYEEGKQNLCPANISASIMAANMWKNSLKNVESVNNKILYETFRFFFYSETVLTVWISLVASQHYLLHRNVPPDVSKISWTRSPAHIKSLSQNSSQMLSSSPLLHIPRSVTLRFQMPGFKNMWSLSSTCLCSVSLVTLCLLMCFMALLNETFFLSKDRDRAKLWTALIVERLF